MKTIEFFAGTGSFSKVAKSRGHDIFRVDNNKEFELELLFDLNDLTIVEYLNKPFDVAWFSPPCTFFSVASIGKHWNKDHSPKSEEAVRGLTLLENTIYYITLLLEENPDIVWFLENPRGKMRKIIEPIFDKYFIERRRHTITYCQYGDTRMKPTDIWTNSKSWTPKPMCKNGDGCHVSAPRGSKTGTQGLKGNMERSVIPPNIFKEIFRSITKQGKINETKK